MSRLYDPGLSAQVTRTGQLVLLILVAMLREKGVDIESADTDGPTVKASNASL